MTIESFVNDFWGVAVVAASFLLWWIIRPIWNLLITVIRTVAGFLNRFLFRPLSRVLVWVLRFILRWFFRFAPVAGVLVGLAVAVTVVMGEPIIELPNSILNGALMAVGLALLTPIIWAYYARHSGTGFAGIERLASDAAEEFNTNEEPEMDLSLELSGKL